MFILNRTELKPIAMSAPKILWKPEKTFTENSNMFKYMNWVNEHYNIEISDYQQLWNWSVNHQDIFWESILKYYNISYSGNFIQARTSKTEIIENKWFEGIQLNYAEHVFKDKSNDTTAITFQKEGGELINISIKELKSKTAKLASYLKSKGIGKGDRVCSMLSNTPEAVIAFLATNSLGAIWTSCSPDFGTKSIIDRFSQIQPKIFISVNGYHYNGKSYDKSSDVETIQNSITSIESIILIEAIEAPSVKNKGESWNTIQNGPDCELTFERVDFSHPIWVLYSSGTTGKPKAITHSVGGILIEHFKALGLHQNIKPGDKFFWYSTTGWMMWNYATSSLLLEGTIAIYDGSPTFPDKDSLWRFAEKAEINHFGAGASYYLYCMKEGMDFTKNEVINKIQSFGSTGSPLPPEGFSWFYENVNPNAWVISLSGGTDICSGFVGGNPMEPVYEGEIQCRMLGVNLQAYNENGNSAKNELGEMIIENAMPSMPIYFWNDENNARYRSSYFEMYPGKWRHGDWIKITERNTVIIYGRSDATLNRGGIRIGTAEVYSAAESIEEITDSLIVCLDHEDGSQTMPIFIQLKPNETLNDELIKKIKSTIRSQFSPRHVPDSFYQIDEIPYTISGKKMEAPVKKILSGIPIEKAASVDAMKNPKSLDFFVGFQLD